MSQSKIKNRGSFIKILKDLHKFNLIIYNPSHSSNLKTSINIIDLTIEQNTVVSTNLEITQSSTSVDKASKQLSEGNQVLTTFDSNKLQPDNIENNFVLHSDPICSKEFYIPEFKYVVEYFKSNNSTIQEASKFFNHFKSVGWVTSNKTLIVDWQAAASKWITTQQQYESRYPKKKNGFSPHDLVTNKDYNIPI
ncbi:MAG: hypothetical protein ABI851_13100 [Saprospiraceae bacterium]